MTGKTTPMDATNRVVANVRRLREIRGWLARELAERMTAVGCPMSRSVISNREGAHCPSRVSADELVAFADVFGKSITDLVAEEMIACPRCNDKPPTGFTCNNCGVT